MRKLQYVLMSSENTRDPRQRAQSLVNTALEEGQVLRLIAKALRQAQSAANGIEDHRERLEALDHVQKAMQRVGYDPVTNCFRVQS